MSRFGGPEWKKTDRYLVGGMAYAPPIQLNGRVVVVPSYGNLSCQVAAATIGAAVVDVVSNDSSEFDR